MSPNEGQYFDGIKVGDTFWHLLFGICRVEKINQASCWPIGFSPISSLGFSIQSELRTIDFSGKSMPNLPQLAFWTEVEIKAPPRPKKTVTKFLKVYFNPYTDSGGKWEIDKYVDGSQVILSEEEVLKEQEHKRTFPSKSPVSYAPIQVEED